jgi:hypothetical protein
MLEDTTLFLAAERQRALHAEARRRTLVRIASCCRPTPLRRAITAWQVRHRATAACCR